jgi:GNAT superfamily N-acetyltransferase
MMGPEEVILRRLQPSDSAAFQSSTTFQRYMAEAQTGIRSVHVAVCDGEVAGYVTLLWEAEDPAFRELKVPEISDLRVNGRFRCKGIGSALLDRVEAEAASRSTRIGLNVGLHSGYGAAQRIYVRRGYVPDGAGIVVEGKVVPEGATIRLDDDPIVTLRMTKELVRHG